VVTATPPPSNPSDAQIDRGRADANAAARRVGELTNQLALAEDRLRDLDDQVELAMEQANKARVDLESARETARRAGEAAATTRTEADAASAAIEQARARVDDFVAGSYQQGSTIGSISAFLGAASPEDLLARQQMLNAVGADQLSGLDQLQRARTDKANKDSAARKAAEQARQAQDAAEQAQRTVDAARDAAIGAQRAAAGRAQQLAAEKAEVEGQLAAAQARVGGLEAQRRQYQQWVAARGAQQAVSAHRGLPLLPLPVAGAAQIVIDRALSQVGVPYAWGGGNASGPTRGIRDGGVADTFGDYDKIGFDCSGLMLYAFAGVGIRLPHYSGYQYEAGRHVPVFDAEPGDMLFWGEGQGVHHVALYLGDGRMVEAPYSGSVVRVVPVRYGKIMPFATRLL